MLPPMDLWNEARVALYSRLRRWLPSSVREWIGQTSLTAPLRRSILWPHGARNLVESSVDFHGNRFRFAASVKVAESVRRVGGIENGLCRLILKECVAGGCVLDIGANYGFVSLVMAAAVGPSGRVHSFEADPLIGDALAGNVRLNNLEHRCTVVHGFVGKESDGKRLVSIDEYVQQHAIERLDFIKIDVDGPDLQVLEGARRSLERFHPVVVIEMTGDQSEIVALLRSFGYQCCDMFGKDVTPPSWPENVFAAVGRRLAVPRRI